MNNVQERVSENRPNGARPAAGRKSWSSHILTFLFIVMTVTAGYFYWQYRSLKQNPNALEEKKVRETIDRVGKLLVLPRDETPTMATVDDREKLKDQAFFADAENGDKILLYTQSRKAIIFRERENRIVNVGPILLNTDVASQDAAASENKK